MLLAHIWNEHGKFPREIYNLPLEEKIFIYEATKLNIEARNK